MDAGLPNANQLTEEVYSALSDAKSEDARLFGLIISKLLVRHVRRGGSPYDPLNIEHVYDALKRFINRDTDVISEFVTGWDAVGSSGTTAFDANSFAKNMASAFSVDRSRRIDGGITLSVNERSIIDATDKLQRAFGGEFYKFQGASLEPFLNILSKILHVEDNRLSYIREFLNTSGDGISCIATLNYDRIVEQSLESVGEKYDLGLSQWNQKRFVRFHGQSRKLIKLHGSIDWFTRNEDEIEITNDPVRFLPMRAMVFGGQNEKLVPHGPFLHLRHEFQKFLRQSSKLLIVGYSFGDSHLNAIIRSWVATRTNAQMMVVGPDGFPAEHPVMRYAKNRQVNGVNKSSVRLNVVNSTFASSLDEIASFLTGKR